MKSSWKDNRTASFLIVLSVYIVAGAAAFLVYWLSSGLHLLIATLLADIAATIVVWLSGIIFRNSSVYDPYWSVAPIFIIVFWILVENTSISVTDILFIIAISVWGIRLTVNWAMRWKGMTDQDWRYTMFRERSPRMWFLTNFFGINMMPTLIVFIALTPAYYGLDNTERPAYYAILGFVICILAVTIQTTADRQMDSFKKNGSNRGRPIDRGLWRYSRHPNYLGEISFWWGIWLMQIWIYPQAWWTVAGPVLMTLLFVLISIPMMERHILETRPDYRDYQKKVSVLKFLPRRD